MGTFLGVRKARKAGSFRLSRQRTATEVHRGHRQKKKKGPPIDGEEKKMKRGSQWG